jgi:excisionase family DNA binding protein
MIDRNHSQLLNRRQIAARYRVGVRTVDRWIAEKRIPVLKLGARCLRFDPERCDAAIRAFEVRAVTEGI